VLRLTEIVIDCHDPAALAAFWTAALGFRTLRSDDHEVEIGPADGSGPALVLLLVPGRKTVKNRLHLDLRPEPGGTIDAEVDRLLALGATRADIGQGEIAWTVLADPEGNEFCVLAPVQ
jgi:hypothetical protein